MINPRLGALALALVIAFAGATELGDHQLWAGVAFLVLALLIMRYAFRKGRTR